MVTDDEGGFVVPQKDKDKLVQWFRLTMGENEQKVMTRLIVTRSRFALLGTHNEECAEYVLSVLDYIMGHTPDDPTSDWTIKQTPLT